MEEVVENGTLLQVRNLKKYFPVRGGFFNRARRNIRALDGISFDLRRGETLGIVGESGCGKSTLGKCILRLEDPTEGQIWFKGKELLNLRPQDMQHVRAQMQMVYQDPYSSLDPRMSVASIVAEPLTVHGIKGNDVTERVAEMIRRVGLSENDLSKYPHMFSGGQRQRISIARALILNPSLVILDEPTSALDVSVQARLLMLFRRLRQDMGLTCIFISHDMRIISYISDVVAVMYLGEIVEQGPTRAVFDQAQHPYTKGLLAAMPSADPDRKLSDLVQLMGEVQDPSNIPSGCRFLSRCPIGERGICDKVNPPIVNVGPDHWVRCHFATPGR